MSAQWIYRHVPLINSEVSLLIAFYIMVIQVVAFCGGVAVYLYGVDMEKMAYVSFWAFDFAVYGMFLTPWLPLPTLKNYTTYQRLQFMIEIWIWLYILIALTYEVPWVFGYQDIAYAEDSVWGFAWWSYIKGGDIRYLYVDLHVLFAEAWACLNALIASFALYFWYKSKRTSVAAVYTLMFCAGMHITATVQYYSLEIFHHYPNVDIHNPNNFIAKFILSNSPWLIMPFVVFFWGTRALPRLYGVVKD